MKTPEGGNMCKGVQCGGRIRGKRGDGGRKNEVVVKGRKVVGIRLGGRGIRGRVKRWEGVKGMGGERIGVKGDQGR